MPESTYMLELTLVPLAGSGVCATLYMGLDHGDANPSKITALLRAHLFAAQPVPRSIFLHCPCPSMESSTAD